MLILTQVVLQGTFKTTYVKIAGEVTHKPGKPSGLLVVSAFWVVRICGCWPG
jgi:hypothetical protein